MRRLPLPKVVRVERERGNALGRRDAVEQLEDRFLGELQLGQLGVWSRGGKDRMITAIDRRVCLSVHGHVHDTRTHKRRQVRLTDPFLEDLD